MSELEAAAKKWAEARRNLLEALERKDEWLKPSKGGGSEAVTPSPFMPLWSALANAEHALAKAQRE